LTAAAAVLQVRGTINAMIVAGLVMAIGVIIDDAIVDVESVARRLDHRRMSGHGNGETTAQIVLDTAIHMRTAAFYATSVIVAAVLPAFFLRGEAGAFFPPLILSFLLAMAASMSVALIVTPALTLALMSRAPAERRGSPAAGWLQRGYERMLNRTIGAPVLTSFAAAAVLLAGVAALPFFRTSVLPPFNDSDVLIHLRAAPGTSLPEMDRITGRVSREVRSIAGVAGVAAHLGRAIASDQMVSVDSGQIWVGIDPSTDQDATLASIERVVKGYPGIEARLLAYPNQRIASVLAEQTDPIVVRVFGQDLRVLNAKAREIRDAMAPIDGVVNPRLEPQVEEPTVEVKVELAAAKDYGIKPGDVRRAAATLLSGIAVGSLFDQQKVFDVVVWGTPDTRNSLNSVQDLLIDTRSGGHVRLGKVADVAIASTPTVIRHQDISRSLDVTADVDGRDVGAVAEDVRNAIGQIAFPLEYHAELVGDFAERQAADRRAVAVAIAAAIGIFLLLQAALGSWRLAAVSFFVLTLAMVGCVLALAVAGLDVSLGSAAGFVAVFAISMRTGITLLRHYQHLERDEGVAFGEALIQRGSRERCIPIVATAVASGLALLPFALSGSVAGQEITHPMAITIIGGLITSTVLVLFVLPSLYLRYGSMPAAEPAPTAVVVVPEIERVSES
jgi:Cu/Ag efflux pump CusA